MGSINRKCVIWFGEEPGNDIFIECRNRDMEIQVCKNKEEVSKWLNFSRAIVIPDNPNIHRQVRALIDDLKVFCYGEIIIIMNASVETHNRLSKLMQRSMGRIELSAAPFYQVAQRVNFYNSGPPENMGLIITGDQVEENEDLLILLRRAFWDCLKIHLTLLSGGSTSKVYKADAVLSSTLVPNPLPFFVKFDRLDKIRAERNNYEKYVNGSVPFNQRPNYNGERCIEGYLHGLLVGNFVENSESLAEVALRGTFTPAVYSLFNQAMKGWRNIAYSIAYNRYMKEREFSLYQSITEDPDSYVVFPKKQLDESVEELAREYGAISTPKQLIEKINDLKPTYHIRGPIHGDLHAWNVHVRGTDSILIDFYRTGIGPLLWDPAALEVSLCFGELLNQFNSSNIEGWGGFVDNLYCDDAFNNILLPWIVPDGMEGIASCVREIRLYGTALEVEKGTYRQVLAIHLLRRSLRKLKNKDSWELTRLAKAYILAEQLLLSTDGGNDFE